MNTNYINLFFTIFTILALMKTIGYGIYEIKHEKNLFGGICVIGFSVASVVFCNIMFWIS